MVFLSLKTNPLSVVAENPFWDSWNDDALFTTAFEIIDEELEKAKARAIEAEELVKAMEREQFAKSKARAKQLEEIVKANARAKELAIDRAKNMLDTVEVYRSSKPVYYP